MTRACTGRSWCFARSRAATSASIRSTRAAVAVAVAATTTRLVDRRRSRRRRSRPARSRRPRARGPVPRARRPCRAAAVGRPHRRRQRRLGALGLLERQRLRPQEGRATARSRTSSRSASTRPRSTATASSPIAGATAPAAAGATRRPATTARTTGIYVLTGGLKITVPADTTVRRLKLYVGQLNAQGQLDASLSDNSAPAVSDHSYTSTNGNPINVDLRSDLRGVVAGPAPRP